MSIPRYTQGDNQTVLAAVANFCQYYKIIGEYIQSGRIRASVDRGAFVRPQDLLPLHLYQLLGEQRNSCSYAYGPEAGDYALRDLIIEVENIKHGTHYSRENVAIVPGAWAGVELVLEELYSLKHGRFEHSKRPVAVIGPTHYQLFHRAINFYGLDFHVYNFVHSLPHYPNDLSFIDTLLKDNPRVIFLTNPNNPDGVFLPTSFMQALVSKTAELNTYIVIDEIQDFLRRPGSKGLNYGDWIERPHVIRIDSFSKKRALAEYRVGWVLADASILGTRTTGLLGRMSGIMGNAPRAANTAIHALLEEEKHALHDNSGFLSESWAILEEKERYMKQYLAQIPCLEILPTEACLNITVKAPIYGRNVLDIAEMFMRKGALIMPCSGYGYAENAGIFRLTFAERKEKVDFALEVFQHTLAEIKQ